MIRLILLLYLCLCFAMPAHAQGQSAPGFDVEALAAVQSEAIDFMLPRTLEAVTAAQLAFWGLGGLTAIDPVLAVVARDNRLQLLMNGRTAYEITVQSTEAAPSAQAVASITAAVYPPRRRTAAWPIDDHAHAARRDAGAYRPLLALCSADGAVGDRDRRVGRAGIGITLAQHGKSVIVHDVVIGSPGALAGLVPGDVIQWVDGRTAIGKDRSFVEAMLNGPEGTDLRMGWTDGMGPRAAPRSPA